MAEPGSVSHLSYEWPAPARRYSARPAKAPPIIKYLIRHPWHIPRLFSRDVPETQKPDLETQAAGIAAN
jgi:hypothetical protein